MKISLGREHLKSHGIFWALSLIYTLIVSFSNGSILDMLFYNFFRLVNLVMFFYLLILYVFNLWFSKKLNLIIAYVLSYVFFLILPYIRWYYFYPVFFEAPDELWMMPNEDFFKTETLTYILLSIIGLSYYLRRYNLHKIELQNLHDKLLLTKELNFYKMQFNPHITFNFLNHAYSKANRHSKEAAGAIELYSDMLRYTTSQKAEEKVLLEDEVRYISNYIKLKRHLNKPCYLSYKVQGEPENHVIYPRILLTLVENAFKHGDYTDPAKPISISINIDNNDLVLYVSNLIDTSRIKVSTGVGQDNLRKSLEIFYPDKHTLEMKKKEDMYHSKLQLTLSP